MDYKVLAKINESGQMIVPLDYQQSDEHVEMNSKRPENGYYIAGSNGDWIRYTAQEEQAWVQSEINWIENEEQFAGDDEREEYPSCELCDYKIELRDYVTCDEGVLTVHGDRPTRPVKNDLQMALDHKMAAIDHQAEQHIATEFQSNALGDNYSYDCRTIDQLNLQHAIYEAETSSASVGYLAKAVGGFYQERQHTEAQLRTVHLAMTAHIRVNRDIARSKKALVCSAFDDGDIDAIKAVDEMDWT